ncbi:hypothetical protein [Actinomadura roseirufa]|uniref:hypothetical protein n=1 Tax=Actinomadura roseirufa TaxID=2094049 RepID=UPI0010416CDE|nr:hypothetical protein [Actinomadura roseirufa]
MGSSPKFEHESFAQRHRGGMLLERHGLELYPHPFLGFTLAPGHRSDVINIDDEGFRLSASPFGTVDSTSWLADGGGGIILGNSVALGLAATADRFTPASHLAELTGTRWLNLGLCASISLQELVAAAPFLHAASSVAILGGGTDLVNLLGSMTPDGLYGTISYERTFNDVNQVPVFDLAALAAGKAVPDMDERRLAPRATRPWDLAEVETRMREAARRRLRDLRTLARAAGDGTRIALCLQPLATPRTRDLTPGERERFDFDVPVFGILHSTIEKYWDAYAALLAEGCAEIGVSFLNMAADRFEGDAFADIVHPHDDGNRQAAHMIRRALDEAPVLAG